MRNGVNVVNNNSMRILHTRVNLHANIVRNTFEYNAGKFEITFILTLFKQGHLRNAQKEFRE